MTDTPGNALDVIEAERTKAWNRVQAFIGGSSAISMREAFENLDLLKSPAEHPAAIPGLREAVEFPYDETFYAISEAVKIVSKNSLNISVKAFQKAFNSRRAYRAMQEAAPEPVWEQPTKNYLKPTDAPAFMDAMLEEWVKKNGVLKDHIHEVQLSVKHEKDGRVSYAVERKSYRAPEPVDALPDCVTVEMLMQAVVDLANGWDLSDWRVENWRLLETCRTAAPKMEGEV